MIRLKDHHKTRKGTVKIATWNVRTLSNDGKLDNIKQEMEREKISILGLCETRWKGAGMKIEEGCKMFYSGGEVQHRGVAIILDKQRSKSVKGYWAVSEFYWLN